MTDIRDLQCRECDVLRVNVGDHSVCPQGHGRLHPFIPAGTITRAKRQAEREKTPVAAMKLSESNVCRLLHAVGSVRVKRGLWRLP